MPSQLAFTNCIHNQSEEEGQPEGGAASPSQEAPPARSACPAAHSAALGPASPRAAALLDLGGPEEEEREEEEGSSDRAVRQWQRHRHPAAAPVGLLECQLARCPNTLLRPR